MDLRTAGFEFQGKQGDRSTLVLSLLPEPITTMSDIEIEEPTVEDTTTEDVVEEPEFVGDESASEIKLFGKWSFEDIEIRDISLVVSELLVSQISVLRRWKEGGMLYNNKKRLEIMATTSFAGLCEKIEDAMRFMHGINFATKISIVPSMNDSCPNTIFASHRTTLHAREIMQLTFPTLLDVIN